jgi:hypothetical protein
MRLSGKKILRNKVMSRISSKQETRDGILWDILPDDRVGRVKIQGSNKLIVSHYPQHWITAPEWMKSRMAVRIAHVGGDRGKIEVTGMGRSVPTPVSGDVLPTIGVGSDGLINGCQVVACKTARMAVIILTGSFQISGIVYDLTPITMANGAQYKLNDGGLIGEVAGAIAIDAAPAAGQFRYDLISVGINCIIDYTKGTASATPVKPDLDSNHIVLAYILVPGGATVIENSYIGHEYSTPTPSSVEMTIADDDIEWANPVTTNITLKLFDQYGNPYSTSLTFTLEINRGNGTVHSEDTGDSTTLVTQLVSGYSYVFTYTRDKIDPGDISPILIGKAIIETLILEMWGFIRLYNAAGELMS